MFGVINKGIEDMICSQYGEETWEAIKLHAGVDIEAFISMDAYPDEITYRLVDAASAVLEMPPTDVLEAFGKHWVLFTGKEGFGYLLEMAGDNLLEFIQNLDNLHARIGLSFPKIDAPGFLCSDIQTESLKLHYYSNRPGLTPLLIGMIKGLGENFSTEVEVKLTHGKDGGNDHQELAILHKPKCPFKRFLKQDLN